MECVKLFLEPWVLCNGCPRMVAVVILQFLSWLYTFYCKETQVQIILKNNKFWGNIGVFLRMIYHSSQMSLGGCCIDTVRIGYNNIVDFFCMNTAYCAQTCYIIVMYSPKLSFLMLKKVHIPLVLSWLV